MTKIQLIPDYYMLVIFCIIFFLGVVLLFYFIKGNESFTDTYTYLRIFVISTIFILFLLVFAYEVIVIYITVGVETGSESWIFVLVNSLLLGIYLNVCGFILENNNRATQFLMFGILVYFSVSGFGFLGILIEIRKPLSNYLMYRFIQTNSSHGILFMFFNFVIFLVIYFVSFILEKEKR